VARARLDVLVTNEMPFGPWIAGDATFDRNVAEESVELHSSGLRCLSDLEVRAVVSSRPVWANDRLANEAFILERGSVRPLHRKQYLPAEPGWFETTWYSTESAGFEVANLLDLRIGVLLCTEAMFNEHARHYGRQGADLIAIPRATGVATDMWFAAGKMAAIVSGSYVVSSNRVGHARQGLNFGGAGFAFDPDGTCLAVTSCEESLIVCAVDPVETARRRTTYPCYVSERRSR
jgi:N-carbamoylputrescine amidase